MVFGKYYVSWADSHAVYCCLGPVDVPAGSLWPNKDHRAEFPWPQFFSSTKMGKTCLTRQLTLVFFAIELGITVKKVLRVVGPCPWLCRDFPLHVQRGWAEGRAWRVSHCGNAVLDSLLSTPCCASAGNPSISASVPRGSGRGYHTPHTMPVAPLGRAGGLWFSQAA